MKGIPESVSTFLSRKDGYEDRMEYLETVNLTIEEKYLDEAKALVVNRLVFRARPRNEALK